MEIKKSIIGNSRTVLREYLIMTVVVLCLGMVAGMIMYAIDPLKAHGQLSSYTGTGHTQLILTTTPIGNESGIKILDRTAYIDNDYYFITGQIQNVAGFDLQFVKVSVTLYDKNNSFIGTDYTYADDMNLATNATTTFKLMIGPSDISTGNVYDIGSFDIRVSGRGG